jgi:hypothetical protein
MKRWIFLLVLIPLMAHQTSAQQTLNDGTVELYVISTPKPTWTPDLLVELPPELSHVFYENDSVKTIALCRKDPQCPELVSVEMYDKNKRQTYHLKGDLGCLDSIDSVGHVVCVHGYNIGNFTYAGPMLSVFDLNKPGPKFETFQYWPDWFFPDRKWGFMKDPCAEHPNHQTDYFFKIWRMDDQGFLMSEVKNEGAYKDMDVLSDLAWSDDSHKVVFQAGRFKWMEGKDGPDNHWVKFYQVTVELPDRDPVHMNISMKQIKESEVKFKNLY